MRKSVIKLRKSVIELRKSASTFGTSLPPLELSLPPLELSLPPLESSLPPLELRFHLWNFKLRKQFPRLDPLCDHILDTLSTIFLIKPKVKKMFTYCNSVSNIVQAAG